MICAILIPLALGVLGVLSVLSIAKAIGEVVDDVRDARERRTWKESMQQARLYESASVDGHRDGRQQAL